MAFVDMVQKEINALAKAIAARVIARMLPPLMRMELFLKEACNLRCDYCFVATKKAYKRMSKEVAQRAIDFLMRESRDEKEVNVTFFGGEPLLAFSMMKFVAEYATEKASKLGKQVKFACTTNGTLLSEEHLRFARQYGFLYLISIDGVEEVHDKYRVKADGMGVLRTLWNACRCLRNCRVGWGRV
jgi:uncharacterized protein